MNTQVSATGMQLKATTSRNLLISKEAATGFGPTIALDTGKTTMVPCSATSTTTDSDFAIFTMLNRGTGMTADNWEMGTGATFNTAEATHYAKQTVYIKSTGSDATNLKCAITNTATSGVLEKSLRVMFVYTADDETYEKKIYAPIEGAEYGGNAIASVSGGTSVLATSAETISDATTTIITALTADTPYKLDIYVWYEGQDTSCFATNAQTVAGATLSFTFTTTAGA